MSQLPDVIIHSPVQYNYNYWIRELMSINSYTLSLIWTVMIMHLFWLYQNIISLSTLTNNGRNSNILRVFFFLFISIFILRWQWYLYQSITNLEELFYIVPDQYWYKKSLIITAFQSSASQTVQCPHSSIFIRKIARSILVRSGLLSILLCI